MSKSQMKTMLMTFFDSKGIVHYEFIPQGQTVNQAYYVEIMKRLREAVCKKKRPELWPNDWILHHDKAAAHKALSVQKFLAQKSITEMEHPPYPDSAPNDFFLLTTIMSASNGRRHSKKCDGSTVRYSTIVMFPTVAA
jgi:hypothetical protein